MERVSDWDRRAFELGFAVCSGILISKVVAAVRPRFANFWVDLGVHCALAMPIVILTHAVVHHLRTDRERDRLVEELEVQYRFCFVRSKRALAGASGNRRVNMVQPAELKVDVEKRRWDRPEMLAAVALMVGGMLYVGTSRLKRGWRLVLAGVGGAAVWPVADHLRKDRELDAVIRAHQARLDDLNDSNGMFMQQVEMVLSGD